MKQTKKPLLLSLALLLLFATTTHSINTEDVHKLTSEFSTFTQATWDVVQKLKHISKHAATFVRYSGPIGSLLAAGAEVAFPPKSDEFKAITALHKYVAAKFDSITRHVQHQTNEMKSFISMNDYIEVVTDPIVEIERFYFDVIDPYGNRTHYKAGFVSRCKDRQSPHAVLQKLKTRLYTLCPMPTNQEAEFYVQAVKLFRQIEREHMANFKISIYDYERLKRTLLTRMSTNEFMLQKFKTIAGDNLSTTRIEKELHKLRIGPEQGCWLKTAIEGNEWLRAELLRFADFARQDLLKTTLIATQCANITNNGNMTEIEKEMKAIETLLKEITNHMADWIEEKLKSGWPKIMEDCAEEALGSAPIEESAANYQAASVRVKKAIDQRGPATYFNNVLIFNKWNDPRQVATKCDAYHCFLMTDHNEVNVLAVRYLDNQYERAKRANNWYNEKVLEIANVIEEWHNENSSQILENLMEILQERIEGFCDPDLFKNAAILKNWAFFKSDSAITVGRPATFANGFPTFQSFFLIFDPFFTDSVRYYLHVML
ncbi:hypothetical protein niasHT_026609 [Heterodera trifolii]|uniref:Uncharacterized protein n=1 Tax=Heterodera trifolii TaxID=157864 RepID=A0ABD2KU26_9BILA